VAAAWFFLDKLTFCRTKIQHVRQRILLVAYLGAQHFVHYIEGHLTTLYQRITSRSPILKAEKIMRPTGQISSLSRFIHNNVEHISGKDNVAPSIRWTYTAMGNRPSERFVGSASSLSLIIQQVRCRCKRTPFRTACCMRIIPRAVRACSYRRRYIDAEFSPRHHSSHKIVSLRAGHGSRNHAMDPNLRTVLKYTNTRRQASHFTFPGRRYTATFILLGWAVTSVQRIPTDRRRPIHALAREVAHR